MKFFIDTADLDEIREAESWGVLSGVMTNPSLYAKTGGKLADFEGHMLRICEICAGLPMSAESQAALLGADIATVPFDALRKAIRHPLTNQGRAGFDADWEKVVAAQ